MTIIKIGSQFLENAIKLIKVYTVWKISLSITFIIKLLKIFRFTKSPDFVAYIGQVGNDKFITRSPHSFWLVVGTNTEYMQRTLPSVCGENILHGKTGNLIAMFCLKEKNNTDIYLVGLWTDFSNVATRKLRYIAARYCE